MLIDPNSRLVVQLRILTVRCAVMETRECFFLTLFQNNVKTIFMWSICTASTAAPFFVQGILSEFGEAIIDTCSANNDKSPFRQWHYERTK